MYLISRAFLLFLLVSLSLPEGRAQDVYVPEPLRDWQGWVLEGNEFRACPFYFDRGATRADEFVCAWPGELQLDLDADGGRFSLRWSVYADEQWLALPGDPDTWPQAVAADGRAVAVVARGNVPSVRLGPGEYLLTGDFGWSEMPAVLQVPNAIGLITLRVDGALVDRPERARGALFLRERETATQDVDRIRIDVFRLVQDEVPTRLVTRLRLNVAGSVREEIIESVLPEAFVPLTLESPLPARLEAGGELRLQVRPGTWVVNIAARGPGVVDALSPPVAAANETWSFAANDTLRVSVVEGVTPVDPRQAGVPGEWQSFPAYRLDAGDTMRLVERSRGMAAADNALTLTRRLWLDFGGSGFITSDQVRGSMRTDWRLDMEPPYRLLNATVGGADLLITDGTEEGQTGVELRRSAVQLDALGRIEARDEIAVTGWAAPFTSVATVLNVPPGRLLLAAPGVDSAGGSWVGQWQLIDFFVVLVITIGTWRLFGPVPGVLALFAVTLGFHENDAPAWLWLNILIAIALCRVAPAGRLLQSAYVYRAASALILAIAVINFVVWQIGFALYPQLERGLYPMPVKTGVPVMMEAQDAMLVAPEMVEERRVRAISPAADESPGGLSMSLEPAAAQTGPAITYSRYAPDALVQAGAGKPAWSWQQYRLDWSGPVAADQAMRLVILPAWAVSLLRLLDVGLVLVFAAILAAEVLGPGVRLPGPLGRLRPQAAGTALVGCIALLAVPAADVSAQMPDPALLEELEARLLAPPACAPRCAEIVAADVTIAADQARMQLAAHAFADVAIPLPGTPDGWRPTAIRIDGAGASRVLRGPGQALYLRLPAGRHTIELAGALPASDSVEIPFPLPPRAVTAAAEDWLVDGLRDRRLVTGSLQLSRLRDETDATAPVTWETSRFPPFAVVNRSVRLDLDWIVVTRVQRVAPTEGAMTLDIPLLPDEAVITEGLEVADGRVRATLAPNQRVLHWQSTLPRSGRLELQAEAGAAWQEIWQVGVGRAWRTTFTGVPESEARAGGNEARVASFYPRSGETLAIDIVRPAATAGATLAFDAARLDVDVGSRSTAATLAATYRSTRGGQHVLRLPQDAEVTGVQVDGRNEPLRAEGGELALPILPGEHTISVSWRTTADVGSRTRTPAVDLGAAASNLDVELTLPRNRWLLATGGPALGPAVLYWPQLAALALFAFLLGRTRLTPLGTWQWLLLGLGFSTFNWPVFAWVAAWLLLSGARDRLETGQVWWQFNALQVLLAVFTVSALLAIVISLPQGLLGVPNMHVTGNGSYGNVLRWFSDRSDGVMPAATAWTAPLWSYKALILAWALWLSFALLRWLPWVWERFSQHGYWRARPS